MEATTIIALCISGLVFVLSLVTFIVNLVTSGRRNVRNDENRLNEINQSLIKVNMKLDQVCATTTNIQADIKVMQNKQIEHTEQILKLENNINRAHERIDELRDKVNSIKGIEILGK